MFGRRYAPDARDHRYPMRALIAPEVVLPSHRYWRPGTVLDQGQRGICVGAGWEGWERASPVRKDPLTMEQIYCAALAFDEWPENDADCQHGMQAGTSVRAAAKALQDKGIITAYHWSATATDVADYILGYGPVVIGTDWYSGMMVPDSKGQVKLDGAIEGGHCTLLYGANSVSRLVLGQNSWGVSWGLRGRFRLTFDQLDQLLADKGEACAAVQAL